MPLSRERNRKRYHERKRAEGVAHVLAASDEATEAARQLFLEHERLPQDDKEAETLYWRQYWERHGR